MSVRKFWEIAKRLLLFAKQNNFIVPEDIMCTQILSAISLSITRRNLVLAHFESTKLPKNLLNLQNISSKLFTDSYNDVPVAA